MADPPEKSAKSLHEVELLELFGHLTAVLRRDGTAMQLERIRDHFDTWQFESKVRDALRGINDPERIGQIVSGLRRIARISEDRASDLDDRRETVRILGGGGSAALVGGALLAAFTLANPVTAVLAGLGGGFVAWRSAGASRRASREINCLRQIAAAAKRLSEFAE